MLTATELRTRLELHGRTVRDRCAELFIRSEFDRFVNMLMADTFVSMLTEIHRTGGDAIQLSERTTFAGITLRDYHTNWFLEEGDDDQDGIGFLRALVRSTAQSFRLCMSAEVETFWASQDQLEDDGFMHHLAPAVAVIRQLLEDSAGIAATSPDDTLPTSRKALPPMATTSLVPNLHPIFTLPDADRCRHIRDDMRLSICLHELGHFLVARHFAAPFASIVLPDLGPDANLNTPAYMPAAAINMGGLSRAAKLGICVAGYAGELCLFEKDYVQQGGEIHVCVQSCANDAAEIISIGRLSVSLPSEAEDIQRVLINCIQALKFEPYNILYGDIIGFRRMVTLLYSRWQTQGFQAMAVVPDVRN